MDEMEKKENSAKPFVKNITYFYAVTAKCGHVGMGKYILRTFYVEAKNGKEAAQNIRKLPRVKHDHKDAIQKVVEISFDDYLSGIESNKKDPYLKCKNIQEQKQIYNEIAHEILEESEELFIKNKKKYATEKNDEENENNTFKKTKYKRQNKHKHLDLD